jgi:hypothetical protein
MVNPVNRLTSKEAAGKSVKFAAQPEVFESVRTANGPLFVVCG